MRVVYGEQGLYAKLHAIALGHIEQALDHERSRDKQCSHGELKANSQMTHGEKEIEDL